MIDLFPEVVTHPEDMPNERYTTAPTINWAKGIAGVEKYDLDVAACAESHWAERYYTLREDGLTQPWFGHVWCNPPYDNLDAWARKAWREWFRGEVKSISMLPPGDRADQPWWHELIEPFRDGRVGRVLDASPLVSRIQRQHFGVLTTHNVPGRQRYGHPGNPRALSVQGAMFPNVLLLWSCHDSRRMGVTPANFGPGLGA